jgi:hypothetical protein
MQATAYEQALESIHPDMLQYATVLKEAGYTDCAKFDSASPQDIIDDTGRHVLPADARLIVNYFQTGTSAKRKREDSQILHSEPEERPSKHKLSDFDQLSSRSAMKATLRHWSQSRLTCFVERYLGKRDGEPESSRQNLQEAAEAVINALLSKDSKELLHHEIQQLEDTEHKSKPGPTSNHNSAKKPSNDHRTTATHFAPIAEVPTPAGYITRHHDAHVLVRNHSDAPDLSAVRFHHGSVQHRYDVVFSYQSEFKELLFKLRNWLRGHGITTADGTMVRTGCDWRAEYFPVLKKGTVMVLLLSKSFLFSRGCEDELTFGYNNRKTIIPLLVDEKFRAVLRNPENFVHECADIEIRAPKFEAILQGLQHFPSGAGEFEDHFEMHAKQLLARLHECKATALAKKAGVVSPDHSHDLLRAGSEEFIIAQRHRETIWDAITIEPNGESRGWEKAEEMSHMPEGKRRQLMSQLPRGEQAEVKQARQKYSYHAAAMLVKFLYSASHPEERDCSEEAVPVDIVLEEMLKFLYPGTNMDKCSPDSEHCAYLVHANPVAHLISVFSSPLPPNDWHKQDEHAHTDGVEYRPLVQKAQDMMQAIHIVRCLAIPGGSFGDGMGNFRKTFGEEGGVPALVELIKLAPKELKHMAISAIAVLSRCKSVKLACSKKEFIYLFTQLVQDETLTSMTRAAAVRQLWNVAYDPKAQRIMVQQRVIQPILSYLHSSNVLALGRCSAFFVMSHLATLPEGREQVGKSKAIALARDWIQKSVKMDVLKQEEEQTLEGACRLLMTVPVAASVADTVAVLFKAVYHVH